MYEILKDFNFPTDGIEIVSLKKGDTFNYETTSINGLVQEGFLKPIEIETKPLKIKKGKGE